MKTRSIVARISTSAMLVMMMIGCRDPVRNAPQAAADPGSASPVLVFGAASTTDALNEACAAFSDETGIRTTTSFASSAALAQQIIHGAEADVFLSANVRWADRVAEEGLVANRVDLLGNRLVVITSADSQLRLQSLVELPAAGIERLAMADPSAAPAGIYARQTLQHHGVWTELEPKIVAGADVRQVLAYVEQGAAEAGMVYATDAALSNDARVVLEVAPLEENPIVYSLVLLKSDQSEAARKLFDYLQSPKATGIFQRYGFTVRAGED